VVVVIEADQAARLSESVETVPNPKWCNNHSQKHQRGTKHQLRSSYYAPFVQRRNPIPIRRRWIKKQEALCIETIGDGLERLPGLASKARRLQVVDCQPSQTSHHREHDAEGKPRHRGVLPHHPVRSSAK
jgi:hypothetical protein